MVFQQIFQSYFFRQQQQHHILMDFFTYVTIIVLSPPLDLWNSTILSREYLQKTHESKTKRRFEELSFKIISLANLIGPAVPKAHQLKFLLIQFQLDLK